MRIAPVTAIELHETENQWNASLNVQRIEEDDPVLSEKHERSIKAEIRYQAYKNIIYNQDTDSMPCYVTFFVFGGVALGILMNSVTTLIPLHDVIKYPEYEYELIGIRMIGSVGFFGALILNCSYWMNIRYILTWKKFVIFWALMTIFIFVTNAILKMIWKKILNYRPPMPFQPMITNSYAILFSCLTLWYLFPAKWRQHIEFKERFKYLVVALMTNFMLVNIDYIILGKIFTILPEKYQWVLAVTFPFLREFHIWIQLKLAYKASDADDTSVTISVSHNINTRHCVFLLVIFGTQATNLSSWFILGLDFMVNAYLAIKIIWIKTRRISNDKNDKEMYELLYSLTINEMVEFVVPLTFLVCFMCAYYGPNGELIVYVRSTYFHNSPVSDINAFIQNMMIFMAVDLLDAIFLSFLLWTCCKISLFRAYILMQTEFGFIIAIITAFTMYGVSMAICFVHINLCDLRYRQRYIYNNSNILVCLYFSGSVEI